MWGLRFKCLTRKPPSSTWTQQHRQQSEKAEWRIVGLVVGTQRRQWRSLYLQHLRHMTVLFCFWDFLVSISWKDVGLVLFQGSHDGRQSVKTCKHWFSHPWRHYRPIISGYWCRTWPCNSGEPSRTHKASTAWKIHESLWGGSAKLEGVPLPKRKSSTCMREKRSVCVCVSQCECLFLWDPCSSHTLLSLFFYSGLITCLCCVSLRCVRVQRTFLKKPF